MTIQHLYEDFIEKSEVFLNCLQEETTLLEDHQMAQAIQLLPIKRETARQHQDALLALQQEDLTQLSQDNLVFLKEVLDELRTKLLANQEMLKFLHGIQEGVITEVIRSVKEYAAPICQYGEDGRTFENKSPVSLSAIDRSF